MECTFIIARFDPDRNPQRYHQRFTVSAEPTDKILDCLIRIRQVGVLMLNVNLVLHADNSPQFGLHSDAIGPGYFHHATTGGKIFRKCF